MQGRRGTRAAAAAAAFVLVDGLLLAAATKAARVPVEPVTGALALVLPPLAAGWLGASWALLALAPVPFALGLGLAGDDEQGLGLVAAGAALSAAALVLLPLGVLAGRRHRARPAVAAAALACGLLVVPVSALRRDRDVRVAHDPRFVLDERAGTFRGAALGDTLREVRARLGPGERVLPADPRRRGVGPADVPTGPTHLATSGDELRFGRDVAFLLDADRRVEWIAVADRRAQTRQGVGPGDALDRFRAAYPGLRCDEGEAGSDVGVPFPQCTVRLRPGRCLYVGGTYDRPGEPAVVLLLGERCPG